MKDHSRRSPIERAAKAIEKHYRAFTEVSGVNLEDAERILQRLLGFAFPHYVPKAERTAKGIRTRLRGLCADLVSAFARAGTGDTKTAAAWADAFLADLPALAEFVRLDAEALHKSDPASKSLSEVVLAYPGCFAVSAYRFAHALLKQGVPLLPRLIAEVAHRQTGIDINPGAAIGRALYIDHGTGVVIGETAVIGDNVQIYQGVTLGALKVEKAMSDKKRHPTIEDNVVIYANATILGGRTVIGHDSVIGGNVWITQSVLPHSRVMYKSSDEAESGLNWTI
ncbi:MAG TPA: serine O-acetyltransferase EpsC [Sphingomonadales bacterium]|nr:serine O-acetyltransferase EpsC [Sphingomonadales bacterium]